MSFNDMDERAERMQRPTIAPYIGFGVLAVIAIGAIAFAFGIIEPFGHTDPNAPTTTAEGKLLNKPLGTQPVPQSP